MQGGYYPALRLISSDKECGMEQFGIAIAHRLNLNLAAVAVVPRFEVAEVCLVVEACCENALAGVESAEGLMKSRACVLVCVDVLIPFGHRDNLHACNLDYIHAIDELGLNGLKLELCAVGERLNVQVNKILRCEDEAVGLLTKLNRCRVNHLAQDVTCLGRGHRLLCIGRLCVCSNRNTLRGVGGYLCENLLPIAIDEVEVDVEQFDNFINEYFNENYGDDTTLLYHTIDGTVSDKGKIVLEGIIKGAEKGIGCEKHITFTLTPKNNINEKLESNNNDVDVDTMSALGLIDYKVENDLSEET